MTFWTIVGFEIRRVARQPAFAIVQLLLPLLLIAILGTALDSDFTVRDETLERVEVAIVRQDGGETSGLLDDAFRSPALESRLELTKAATREEAVGRVREGTADFAVVVPAGFGEALLAGEAAQWELISGADSRKNLAATAMFGSLLERLNDGQAAALALGAGSPQGLPAQASAGTGPDSPEASGGAFGGAVKVGQLAAGSDFSAMQYYAAAMLVMFLLYSGMTTGINLALEKERNTLARLHSMPLPAWRILAGKLGGSFLLAVLQAAFIVAFTRFVLGVDWGTSYAAIAAACLCIILFSFGLAVIVLSLAKGSGPMLVIFQIVINLMTFFSGGFIRLPEGLLRRIGEFTVSHWGFQSFLDSMLGRTDGQPVAILGVIAAAFMAGAIVVYRKAGYPS
ncbi:ABC transporter permease [Cohnella massiliensis]|uniref:ABC transporter permease n=1 Tax=Cohnella massiliensis TaxID=1816691 RepID=UPI0009BA73DF|nr:ABC transporter permease [Cohnella massiliensis]